MCYVLFTQYRVRLHNICVYTICVIADVQGMQIGICVEKVDLKGCMSFFVAFSLSSGTHPNILFAAARKQHFFCEDCKLAALLSFLRGFVPRFWLSTKPRPGSLLSFLANLPLVWSMFGGFLLNWFSFWLHLTKKRMLSPSADWVSRLD